MSDLDDNKVNHYPAGEENDLETIIPDDDEEEFITPKQVLENVECAWLNEKHSPDILPYQGDMVELIMGQLAHMEENLATIDGNDFRRITHLMELERIRFIVTSYLRCRLQKIEDFTQHIIIAERERTADKKRLSQAEVKFAEDYFESIEKHFQQLALRHIPPNQDDINKRIIRPNLMSNVFLKVLKPCGIVVTTNDEEVDLSVSSQHMLPFQLISDLVIKGDVQLI